jgi:electron transfer flavoprotein beta subunit
VARGDVVKILALCKYSLDLSELKVEAATRQLLIAGVPRRISGIDRNVIEAAVQLKEATKGTAEALCVGPDAARDAFKDILAIGLDEATLVQDPYDGTAEAGVIVRLLEAAIRARGPFDLIVCGFASDDGYTHQVGPRLAERLGLVLVSYVRRLALDGALLEADRDMGDRLETVSVRLPAIVSIAEEAFPARRTSLLDALNARKRPINVWTAQEPLGMSRDALDGHVRVVSTTEQGVYVQRDRQMVTGGSPGELADAFIDALVAKAVLAEAVA